MIGEIIKLEWEFFQKVQNIGGRASCQDDFYTFNMQRSAQFKVFYQDVRESYLNDLKYYKKIGRNPIEEKYARMMSSNDPKNYEMIKNYLPLLEQSQSDLIESIIEIELTMREEMNTKYPKISSIARKTYTYEDSVEDTSFETYLRGELSTYSPQTLFLYGQMILDMIRNNKNMIILVLEETAKMYGYSCLDELNR